MFAYEFFRFFVNFSKALSIEKRSSVSMYGKRTFASLESEFGNSFAVTIWLLVSIRSFVRLLLIFRFFAIPVTRRVS